MKEEKNSKREREIWNKDTNVHFKLKETVSVGRISRER